MSERIDPQGLTDATACSTFFADSPPASMTGGARLLNNHSGRLTNHELHRSHRRMMGPSHRIEHEVLDAILMRLGSLEQFPSAHRDRSQQPRRRNSGTNPFCFRVNLASYYKRDMAITIEPAFTEELSMNRFP
jgi:hypothetical protein